MDVGRLGAEEVAHQVQRVGAEVRHGAAPESGMPAVVALLDVVGERRGERAGLADDAARDHVGQLHHVGVLVHAVGDHQCRAGALGGGDHRLAVLDGVGHRLLQQHRDPSLERGLCELAVPEYGRGHVDAVDAAAFEQLRELVVVVHRDAVGGGPAGSVRVIVGAGTCAFPLCDGPHLGLRAGNHGGDFRIGEAAQPRDEGLLRDLSDADDREAEGCRLGVGRSVGPGTRLGIGRG